MDYDFNKPPKTGLDGGDIGNFPDPSQHQQQSELLDFLSEENKTTQQQHMKKLSDDFEHVDPFEHYNTSIHKTTTDLDDLMGATKNNYDNFKSDLGTDFSKFGKDMEITGNDLLSSLEKNIENTKDFMAAERGGGSGGGVGGNGFGDQIQNIINTKPNIEQNKSDDDNFSNDSYNPSPVKKPFKITDEHTEKFISSEDLLGDFKDDFPAEPIKSAATVIPTVRDTDKFMAFESSSPVPPLSEPTPPPKIPEKNPNKIDDRPTVPPPAIPSRIEDIKEPTPILPPKGEKKLNETRPKMIQAEEMFYKIGLDAWFKPDRLHPRVESLIYWRDVKKSGIVFGAGLITLLAISCFSAISVIAYLSLLTLTGTIAFRIYKNVLGAIQKTSDGHPFKEFLDMDLTLSQDKVQQICNVAVAHVNAFVSELRRLFLVEDLVDSLKFGLILWVLTYIGAWFNGMTLVILAFISLFTLPKVYEQNKQIIDQNLDIVRSKFLEITDKIKVAIPIGKKPAESEKDK